MGVFCANETLLNLTIDRGDLSLELEQFSYHCSRLRHTEALQPLPQDSATLTITPTAPVNWQHQAGNFPRLNILPDMVHGFREGRAVCTRGKRGW